MMVVISIAQYLTNKGEHTMLHKINKNVYIKPQKECKHNIVFLHRSCFENQFHCKDVVLKG